MTYKGYSIGIIEWDEEAGNIHGRVALSRGMATFVGTTASEAIRAFRDTVDDSLAMCVKHSITPEEPATGLATEKPEHAASAF